MVMLGTKAVVSYLDSEIPSRPRSKTVNSADGIPVSAFEMSNDALLNGRLKTRLNTQLVLTGFSMSGRSRCRRLTHVYSIQ
jgi:hypothetical protein